MVYEPEETQVFLTRIERASIFFDVGAHIGYYSLLAASQKTIRQVVAMEIFPGLAEEIRFHSKVNGFDQILVETIAIGDGTTTIEFGNRTAKTKQKTISLDKFVEDRGLQPDLIKIDIEGFEYLALQGGEQTLSSSPELMLSIHPSYLAQYGGGVEGLLKFLGARYNYLYLIHPGLALQEKALPASLEPLRFDRIPEEDFVLWCSREDLQ
jgi:FkbM family methyltransferase